MSKLCNMGVKLIWMPFCLFIYFQSLDISPENFMQVDLVFCVLHFHSSKIIEMRLIGSFVFIRNYDNIATSSHFSSSFNMLNILYKRISQPGRLAPGSSDLDVQVSLGKMLKPEWPLRVSVRLKVLKY